MCIRDRHQAGKKRLAEIVVGFNDEEPEPEVVPVVDEADAEADDDDDGADAEADEPAPTGPDPVEVAARMEAMGAAYARFVKAVAKGGPDAKPALKAREEMAAVFVTFKLPLPLTDVCLLYTSRCV